MNKLTKHRCGTEDMFLSIVSNGRKVVENRDSKWPKNIAVAYAAKLENLRCLDSTDRERIQLRKQLKVLND